MPFELDSTIEVNVERWIDSEAEILFAKLRPFAPANRLFVIAEIMNRVTRKLRSRESTRYHVDFTHDELPTLPDAKRSVSVPPDLGSRMTGAIKPADLEALKKKSRR